MNFTMKDKICACGTAFQTKSNRGYRCTECQTVVNREKRRIYIANKRAQEKAQENTTEGSN